MEISFKDKKLKNLCEDFYEANRRLGEQRAIKLVRRLNEMQAADDLSIVGKLPQARLHPLKQNRKGQFAVDLAHPYRLIFKPAGIFDANDLKTVNKIKILEIEDYH